MTSPARLKRQLRDRRLSITLAAMIGVVIGIGGWMVWNRQTTLSEPPPETIEILSVTALPLLPHKALYAVTLMSARNGSQIINIDGKMFFQMNQGCDVYITDHRFVLTYDYADSEPMRITSDFSTVETFEGTQFDFSSRRRRNGELYEELRGKGETGKNGMDGAASYAVPDVKTYPLPPGSLFPSAHTRALIHAARQGKKFFAARIFDGSDTEGPVDITAVIGGPMNVLETLPPRTALDREILKTRAWKMRLAFFPVTGGTDTPDYELTMILHENGVISDMVIDYADFAVHQELQALSPLQPEKCNGKNGGPDQD